MTWLGALFLALALYGVVTLLEWLYARILARPSLRQGPLGLSVVLRARDVEASIEDWIRELVRVLPDLLPESVELIASEAGSQDQTAAILERLCRQYRFFTWLEPGLSADKVLAHCRYPAVLWLELSPRTISGQVRELVVSALGNLSGLRVR